MIVGIGCDVVQQERVSQVLERHGDRLAQKLLTESEMRLFEKRRQLSKEHALAYLATRWAAKEAISKALGTGISGDVSFQSMSIMHNDKGAPVAVFNGELKSRLQDEGIYVHISITDEKTVAAAFAVAEKRA